MPATDFSVGNLSWRCKYITQIWYQRGNLNSKLHLKETQRQARPLPPKPNIQKSTEQQILDSKLGSDWGKELQRNQQIVYDWWQKYQWGKIHHLHYHLPPSLPPHLPTPPPSPCTALQQKRTRQRGIKCSALQILSVLLSPEGEVIGKEAMLHQKSSLLTLELFCYFPSCALFVGKLEKCFRCPNLCWKLMLDCRFGILPK